MYFSGKTGGQDSKETAAQTRSKSDTKFSLDLAQRVTHEITLYQVADNFPSGKVGSSNLKH